MTDVTAEDKAAGQAGTGSSRRLPEGAESMTFEQLMTTLESITSRLAVGELDIEEAADLYEQAEALHALAAHRLAQVQERVDRLRPSRP